MAVFIARADKQYKATVHSPVPDEISFIEINLFHFIADNHSCASFYAASSLCNTGQ